MALLYLCESLCDVHSFLLLSKELMQPTHNFLMNCSKLLGNYRLAFVISFDQ